MWFKKNVFHCNFVQGDSRGVTVLKPCTLCGASHGCLGSVPGSGLLQAPRSQFLCFSSSVLVVLLLLSFVVRAACFNMRPLLFFSRPHLSFLVLFQTSRHSAVAIGFRHSWDCACICSGGAFFHIVPPSCSVMGLEFGFYPLPQISEIIPGNDPRSRINKQGLSTKFAPPPGTPPKFRSVVLPTKRSDQR